MWTWSGLYTLESSPHGQWEKGTATANWHLVVVPTSAAQKPVIGRRLLSCLLNDQGTKGGTRSLKNILIVLVARPAVSPWFLRMLPFMFSCRETFICWVSPYCSSRLLSLYVYCIISPSFNTNYMCVHTLFTQHMLQSFTQCNLEATLNCCSNIYK